MQNKKITILKISTYFIGLTSLFMLFNEMIYHFFKSGVLENNFNTMPGATIGFFEAHGLAFLWAIYFYKGLKKEWQRELHLYACLLHGFLAVANTIFWVDAFERFDLETVGFVSTLINYLLAILHLITYKKTK